MAVKRTWIPPPPGQQRGPPPVMLTSAESFHFPWVLGRTKHKAVQCCLLQVNKHKGILVWHMAEKLDLRKRNKNREILKNSVLFGFFS